MLTLLKANLIELDGLWRNHIALEEKTMSPEKTANLLTQEESLHLAQELAEFGQQHSQPAEQLLPFVLYNLEPHHRAQMEHTLPANIVQELIPIVWKSAWSPMLPFLLK